MTQPRAQYPVIQGRFGELWLKGRNRNDFIDRLRSNARAAVKAAAGPVELHRKHGRLLVHLSDPARCGAALEALADVPGLVSVQCVRQVPLDLSAITAEALRQAADEWLEPGSFRVETRRPDKQAALRSSAVDRHVGAALVAATGRPVNLKAPDRTLWIELRRDHAWVWTVQQAAVAGLPVGTSGRALLLLSGGLDSPVAGYLAQKRGCALDAVYFHSPPFIGEASRDKVEQLAARLALRQGKLPLHVVRFTEVQQAIHAHCAPRFAVLLYRRFMYRIANAIAAQHALDALCTGESLGQVASQTMLNLTAVEQVVDRLTLRPLITMDKTDITEIARRIGTYDLSTLPFEDCCTLFVPDHPATHANRFLLERAEEALDVPGLVAQALAATERVVISAQDSLSDEEAP
ncbi:MAG: tRNA 4-thiouridine(8) synthase ThiI [Myxococcales bacterium]|nr:tRNA 4-thiouridine(8) synthase ThiI [Myxococcales bacterium]MCB9526563.1 tRNA 4-thiouridine(8) synthase ThiI [Myxococcales bacterium]